MTMIVRFILPTVAVFMLLIVAPSAFMCIAPFRSLAAHDSLGRSLSSRHDDTHYINHYFHSHWTPVFANDDRDMQRVDNSGYSHTAESRAKISAANKGKVPWNAGQKHSEETRRKIAEKTRAAMRRRKEEKAASMGMTLEEYEAHLLAEKQAKKRKASAGDGAGLTAEGRKRISEATRKRWQDPKFREAYSKRNRGRKHSDKTKAMIAEKVRLLWQHNETYRNSSSQPRTEEQKQRISATLRARWQDDEFRAMMQSRMGERDAAWKERLSESIKLKWQDPNYRKAVTKSAAVRGATRSGARTTRSSPQQQQQRRKQQQQRRRLSEEEKQQRAEERQRKREAVLEQRRQQKLEKQRQKEEREEALRKAKLAATDESKRQSLQSIMGRELWTEEKIKRRKEGEMFKDDATLEEELRKEWSESPEKMTGVEQAEVDELLNGADSADDDDAFVDEEDDFYFDDEYDDDDDLSDDSADDEDDDDYGFNDDESATVGVDDDRMVEVYDERGNLVGIFSGRDYDRIRNKSKN